MRRGRRQGGSDDHGRKALALLASWKGSFAWHFASRASVDSVQFLDSVHSVTGQALQWGYSDDRSGSEKLTEYCWRYLSVLRRTDRVVLARLRRLTRRRARCPLLLDPIAGHAAITLLR